MAQKQEKAEGCLLSGAMRWRRCLGFVSRLNLQGLISDLFLASQKAGNLLAAFLPLFTARHLCRTELLLSTFLGEVMVRGRGTTCQLQNKNCKRPHFFLCQGLLQTQPRKRHPPAAKSTWVHWFQRTSTCKWQGFPPGDSRAAADGTCSSLVLG